MYKKNMEMNIGNIYMKTMARCLNGIRSRSAKSR